MGRLFLGGWNASPGDGRDPVMEMMQTLGGEQGRWAATERRSISYTKHADVRQVLGEFTALEAEGLVRKGSYLGYNHLNNACWPETPWDGHAIGAPADVHSFLAPMMSLLVGSGGKWSTEELRLFSQKFFLGRDVLHVQRDVQVWVDQVLHRVIFGMTISFDKALKFRALAKKLMKSAGSLDLPFLCGCCLGVDEAIRQKREFLREYTEALREHLPDFAGKMSEQQLGYLASAGMDALMLAGGVSISNLLSVILGLPFSSWAQTNCEPALRLESLSKIERCQYILEVIRRFPPVAGFAFEQLAADGKGSRRVFLDCQAAQNDPAVWDRPSSFLLRPLCEYASKSVGFGEPAAGPSGTKNTHNCPGKDLALAMLHAFLDAFVGRAVVANHTVLQYWEARSSKPTDRGHLPLTPEQMRLSSGNGMKNGYVLQVVAGLGMPKAFPAALTGVESLSEEEVAQLELPIEHEPQLAEIYARACDLNTKVHIKFVGMMVPTPGSKAWFVDSQWVKPHFYEKQSLREKAWKAPFGGVAFATTDELTGDMKGMSDFGKGLMFIGLKQMHRSTSNDEKQEVYYESALECRRACELTFGRYLPPHFSAWRELSSDEGMADLCVFGVGGWYLRAASPPAGRAVPKGTVTECNLEYMDKYETRPGWMRYGATCYLGAAEITSNGYMSDPGKLLAIYVSHYEQLVFPGDELWEVAKGMFRCSLGTSITLKDHLGQLHWIRANGLSLAAREATSPNHPLRRLLKQFYFKTAFINYSSRLMLLPVDQFAQRTFAFTAESWVQYFVDVCAGWKWVPFSRQFDDRNLSDAFLSAWPMHEDGLALWTVFKTYAVRYLLAAFSTEDAALADAEVRDFYAHFETQFDNPWGLPPLTFASLTELLADLMFWVTGGHESVGAIAEYLTPRDGLAGKLAPGQPFADVQTHAQALVIIAMTGARQPALMGDWTHLFTGVFEDKAQIPIMQAVNGLQRDLNSLAHEVEQRNEARAAAGVPPCRAFNPRILETSVSI